MGSGRADIEQKRDREPRLDQPERVVQQQQKLEETELVQQPSNGSRRRPGHDVIQRIS